jgi:hypothetical protein
MTGYYNTFVVKIWHGEAGGTIRGHIQHVSTQEQTYFLCLENMTTFIVNHLTSPPDDSVTQDETQGGWAFIAEDFGDTGQDG